MMVFVDTSYLLALVLVDDEHHSRSLAWQRSIRVPLLTTEYVLIEFADALTKDMLRDVALNAVRLLRNSPAVQIIPASTALLDEGLGLFASRHDKQWGLTDCISFVVMHKSEVTKALTSDHHFEQAGFSALLRQDSPPT